MPKINKYKIVNFKYGMSGNRLLSDKVIVLNGDHLQMEATNSVGKSMSIQTLIQAICPLADVNKKFIDIYNVKEPIYTVIEWILDDNKTKLLTGIGFEKKTIVSLEEGVKDKKSNLYKFFTFTIEECREMNIAIEDIPFYEKNNKGINTLKSLNSMDTYIKSLKAQFPDKVSVFGQNSQAQAKYRDKLAEYGIYQSEWKEILIKLNDGEAVLSSFFEEYNTTEKFMKNKVLPLIDNNLNKDLDKNSPIKQLREQVKKFIEHCIKMEDKIKCYEDYSTLLDYTLELKEKLTEICDIDNNINNLIEELSKIYYYCVNENEKVKTQINDLEVKLENLENESININYEEASYDYHISKKEIDRLNKIIEKIDDNISKLEKNIDYENEMINILKYQELNKQLIEECESIAKKEADKEILTLENEEISKKIANISYTIKELSKIKENEFKEKIDEAEENISNVNTEITKLNDKNNNLNNDIKNKGIDINTLELKIKNYENKLKSFNNRFIDINSFKEINLMGETINYSKYISHLETEFKKINSLIGELENKNIDIESQIEKLKEDKFKNHNSINEISNEINDLQKRINIINEFDNKLNSVINQYELNENELSDYENIEKSITKLVLKLQGDKNILLKKKIKKEDELNSFKNVSNLLIDDSLIELLSNNNIEVDFGFNYLLEMETELENKLNFINKYPVLPYSILISENNFNKLKKLDIDYKTKFSTPILIKEKLEDLTLNTFNSVVSINDFNLLLSFDVNLLDNNKRKEHILQIEKEISNIEKEEKYIEEQLNNLKQIEFEAKNINYVNIDKELFINNLNCLINKNNVLNIDVKSIDKKINNLNLDKKENKETIKSQEKTSIDLNSKLKEVKELNEEYISINGFDNRIDFLKEDLSNLEIEINKNTDNIKLQYDGLNRLNVLLSDLKKEKSNYSKLIKTYQLYNDGIIIEGSIDELITKLNGLKNNSVVKNIDDLNYDINNALSRKRNIENDMLELKDNIKIENILDFVILSDKNTISNNIKNLNIQKKEIIKEKNSETKKLNKEEGALEHKYNQIDKKYAKKPMELETITNYDFKKRRSDLLTEINDTKKEINKLNNNSLKLEQLIKDLKKYKSNNIIVVEMDSSNITDKVDKLIKNLDENNENTHRLIKESSKIRDKIEKFNLLKNEQYQLIVSNLISEEISINSQLETINKVELVLNDELNNVKHHKEKIDNEKNIINKQIKDYLNDCIDELKVINKLGRVNGEMLFNIVLPETDRINYSVIEEVIDNLYESKNVEIIESVINSFYLLNKLINISNLKIKVVQYELNNKKAIVNWDKVIKSTSGGQRFCISFIILTILMEYKRCNAKELTHKSTGKVLIMDNPFGETSEEDFLRMVFKLADKFMVQIISYTHVTNASIRVQFNRIYRMTVEKTTNDKEIVVIEEDKNIETDEVDEFVKTSNYIISKNAEQGNLFDLIQ